MDLLHHFGDDSSEGEGHNDLRARSAKGNEAEVSRRRRLRNISLLTEAEWNALASRQGEVESGVALPSAGRWATHCSCPVGLNRSEQRRAWASIRATCDWIERRYPSYRGCCIPLIPPPPRNKRKHSKRRKRTDSSSVVALSASREDSTLHVSLTRPDVSLHTNHVDSFAKLLTREIQEVAHVAPFSVQFQYTNILELFHNESRTKSYGVWRCFDSSSSLEQLTRCCDTILEQYQQMPYRYSSRKKDDSITVPPIFHVSLVRFEPAVLLSDSSANSPCPVIQSSPGTITSSTLVLHRGESDAESCDSSSSEGSADAHHVITRVTCQFGGAAKNHQIALIAK